jgi:hypothetical protein
MAGVVDSAWNLVQKHLATTSVLGILGMTMERFLNSRHELGDEHFADLLAEIREKKQLGLELLVCGFDDKGIPVMLVRADEFDMAFDVSRSGRAFIGSGHAHAKASLAFHKYDTRLGLSEAVYQVCTAKFMSEQSDGVGESTAVVCIRQDGRFDLLSTDAVDQIREMWKRETRPQMPTAEVLNAKVGGILKGQWIAV